MTAGIMHRVAARDQALLQRLQLSPDASAAKRVVWTLITHAGGALVTVVASLAPLGFDNPLREGAQRATIVLIASHFVVQLLKRTISRPRPSARPQPPIRLPDRYSFPSGHSAAAFSVAVGYASTYPFLAAPLVAVASLVGISRVVLGVHFPADVLAGQVIALLTAAAVAPIL